MEFSCLEIKHQSYSFAKNQQSNVRPHTEDLLSISDSALTCVCLFPSLFLDISWWGLYPNFYLILFSLVPGQNFGKLLLQSGFLKWLVTMLSIKLIVANGCVSLICTYNWIKSWLSRFSENFYFLQILRIPDLIVFV